MTLGRYQDTMSGDQEATASRLGGYYWVRPIENGPWKIAEWCVNADGDCRWLGRPYDWNPAKIGEIIPDNDTLRSLRGWRGDLGQ